MRFLAISTPRPLWPTIITFILMSLPMVSIPKVPIYLEYKSVSISPSAGLASISFDFLVKN